MARESAWVKFIDRAIYFIIAFGIMMTIPQVMKIWVEQNASGVSIISWGAYLFISVFWLLYGIAHKDKAVTVSSAFWILLDIFIVLGIALYG